MQIVTQVRKSLEKYAWLVALCFFLLVIALRLETFYQVVLNWDESLYLLIADEWLHGHPPYTTLWDNKPPGIYAIFAVGLLLFGHTIFSMRMAACLFVAIGCYFLYRTGRIMPGGNTTVGLMAGILYAIVSVNNYGNASNTEAFYITFTICAFSIILAGNVQFEAATLKSYWQIFLVGLLLGIGFEIKYVVLFDFIAATVILTLSLLTQPNVQQGYTTLLKCLAALTVGFLLPCLLVSFGFWCANLFDEYSYANFAANKARTINNSVSIDIPLQAILNQLRTNYPLWIFVFATPIYLLFFKKFNLREHWTLTSICIWFFTILLCMSLVFRTAFYDNYFLQLAPAICLLSAFWLGKLISIQTGQERREKLFSSLVVGFLLLLIAHNQNVMQHLVAGAKRVYFAHVKGIQNWEDVPAQAGEYVKKYVTSGDYIYVANYEPILYFLSASKIPSQYAAHPPFLIPSVDFPSITTVNPLQELDAIMQKQPVFVIWREAEFRQYTEAGKLYLESLKKYLSQNYVLDQSIAGTPSTIYFHKHKSAN